LPPDIARALVSAAERWAAAGTPQELHRQMVDDLRGLFPDDLPRRQEVMRRMGKYMTEHQKDQPQRWPRLIIKGDLGRDLNPVGRADAAEMVRRAVAVAGGERLVKIVLQAAAETEKVYRQAVEHAAGKVTGDPDDDDFGHAAHGVLGKTSKVIVEAAARAISRGIGKPEMVEPARAVLSGSLGAWAIGGVKRLSDHVRNGEKRKGKAGAHSDLARVERLIDNLDGWRAPAGERGDPDVEVARGVAVLLPLLFHATLPESKKIEKSVPRGTLLVAVLEEMEKGATHKYLKRDLNPHPPPKYRYYYYIPGRGIVAAGEQLRAGVKIKAEHEGQEGHFEVTKHDTQKKIVHVRHDETGKTAHIHERDLQRMVEAYHKRKGTGGKKTPKRNRPIIRRKPASSGGSADKAPGSVEGGVSGGVGGAQAGRKPLPEISMDDLGAGGWEEIVGFAATPEAAAEIAATRDGHEHAVVKQPNGYVVAARKQIARARTAGEATGAPTKVYMRDKGGRGVAHLDADFVVVEANKLVASHNPLSMAPREDYPENVQERRYHELVGEQMKVGRVAQNIQPEIVVNTNPDGVNGTPVVTEDNVVLGGNGRTMAMQLAYARHPESAAKLKGFLAAHARQFGLSPAEIQQMEQPILVRRVKAGKDTGKLRMLGRRLNEALTQGMDPRTMEVALGKNFVSPELVGALVTEMETDEPLNKYLHNTRSKTFVAALERAGIIDELNRDEFVDPETGLLNEDGRNRVERVLADRFLPDAGVLSRMNQETRSNIAKAVPYLLRAEAAGWDIREPLMAAVKADLAFRAQSKIKTPEDFMRQEVSEKLDPDNPIFALRRDPLAGHLWTVLLEHNGSKKMAAGFREFARRAEANKESGTASMFGVQATESPEDALDHAFGLFAESRKQAKEAKQAASQEEQGLEAAFGISAEDKERWSKEYQAMERKGGRKKVASEGEQEALIASYRRGNLQKAEGGDGKRIPDHQLAAYLMNTVIAELRHLIDAQKSALATSGGGRIKIDGERLKKKLGEAILYAVGTDPDLARAVGAANLTSDQIDGLIEAMTEVSMGKTKAKGKPA
jgi:hypothetical protein